MTSVFSVMADECTDIMSSGGNVSLLSLGGKMALLSNAFWTLCL